MKTKTTSQNVLMLLAIFIGYTCIYLDKTAISLSMVNIAETLNMSAGDKGLILSFFFLGYTIFQIPFSYLSNKIGSRKMLFLSIIMVGLFMVFFGFGASVLYLIIIRLLTGSFAHSGYPSAVSTFISQEIPLEKRGSVQSTMIASSGFAGIIGPPIIALFINLTNWQTTYFILGAFVIAVGVFMMVAIPKTAGTPIVAEGKKGLAFGDVLKDRNVWIMILSAFFINASLYGLNSWLPSYLNETFHLSMTMLSLVSVLIGFFTMAAAMAGGIIINRFFLNKEKAVIFTVTLLGAVFVFLVSTTQSLVMSIIFLSGCIICASVGFSALMSLPVKLFTPMEVSSKYATINAIGVSGGFFAPTIMGKMVEASGGSYTSAFMFISITLLVSGVCVLVVNRQAKPADSMA